jgi:hypothetical protein
MTTSRIPAVWDAVFDALVTAFAPETTVAVTYGEPRPKDAKREHVIVGPVEGWSAGWAGIGAGRRQEEFNLQVQVLVADSSSATFQTPVERAFTLAGTVETTLRNDFDLGVSGVVMTDPVAAGDPQLFWTDDGMGVLITLSCGVTTRI